MTISSGSNDHIIVVGGGLAGLSAACETASILQGRARVTLLERNHHVGGKMNVLKDQGFSFDMGPTILTLPQVLCGIIRRAGRRVEDYIDLVRLDPQWRCFYEDGVALDLRDDPEAFIADLDRQFPGAGAGKGYAAFLAYARKMIGLSEQVFFYKDIEGVRDMMRVTPMRDPRLLGAVLGMRMHSTVGATAHGMIREPHVRQLAEHFLQYVGSSPFLAPAILSLIAAAQSDYGCWYAKGGTRMVARALERLAGELGVQVRTGCGVARITEEGGRATGVVLESGEALTASAVISNCDVQRTLSGLVGSPAAKKRRAKIAGTYTPACSGLVLYLGLSKQYDHLAHHNFIFSRDSQQEFDDIYAKGIPARDPSIYLCVPSRSEPTQAPPGGEALYALIHTPFLREGQRWEGPGGLLEQYRPVVINKLKTCGSAAMPDLERHIVCEHTLTPGGIERLYNAEGGAIYGLASHGRLAGGFKPRNRSRVLKGLYLAGGSVNPGPGVPMVLMSGVTAARSLCEDLGAPMPPVSDLVKERVPASPAQPAGGPRVQVHTRRVQGAGV